MGNDNGDRLVCNWFGGIYWNLVDSAIAVPEVSGDGAGEGDDSEAGVQAGVVEAGEGEDGDGGCEPEQLLAKFVTGAQLMSGGEQGVLQQFVERGDAKSGRENWMTSGCRRVVFGGVVGDFRAVQCLIEIQLSSGGCSGVATGAYGGCEAGVGSECCGESFESLEFFFQQLQLFSVLFVKASGVLPAGESG